MKKIRIQLLLIAIAIISFLVSCNSNPDHPNVVFILADDLGYGDLACQNPGSKVPTPNLDQLAVEGMRFTDAHSPSSVCSPTRYGILTGRYAWRTRLKKSVLWQWDSPLIKANEYTVGQLFKDAGYHTACIGKWHLGWDWAFPDSVDVKRSLPGILVDYSQAIENGPIKRGFDYYFGDDVPNFQPYTFIENDHVVAIPTVMKPDSLFGGKGVMIPGWRLEAVMPAITQKAVDYIHNRAGDAEQTPFFLYFALTAPHTPIAPAEEFLGKSEAGLYGDFVNEVDFCVGEVLKAIKESGIEDNTLVIFTSDNGSPGRNGENWGGPVSSVKQYGHDPSFPWKGVKSDIWEGGHHVPYLVRWPGEIQAGSVNTELIGHLDFMCTMADLLEIDLPTGSAPDSYSILPAYLGESLDKPIREALIHHSGGGMFAIRQGPWKLCLGLGPAGFSGGFRKPGPGEPPGQLYDMISDPGETKNVYFDNPDVVEHLTALLEKYKSEGRSREIGREVGR